MKASRGITKPKQEIELIRQRLRRAAAIHAEREAGDKEWSSEGTAR